MFNFYSKSRSPITQQIFSWIYFILFRWQQRLHFYLIFISLFIASVVSYRQPFGLLFNIKHIVLKDPSVNTIRDKLIVEQKDNQKLAYDWFKYVLQNPKDFSHLISNETQQSIFYDYIHVKANLSPSYALLMNNLKNEPVNATNHIVISILYSKQDTDHREGKFYIGQVLYHLLKNYHPRFIITLCENNNTNEKISDGIDIIRRILPVFVVNSISAPINNSYEREKQAHVQCILANFQSFPNINYFLLLQDDAEPIHKDFFYKLSSLIDYRIEQQWSLHSNRQKPAFIKIYHPTWLIGYFHPSFYIFTQLIATSFLVTFLFISCLYTYRTVIEKKTSSYQLQRKRKVRLPIMYSTLYNFIQTNIYIYYFILYYSVITSILVLLNHSNVSWTWRSLHPAFYSIYPTPSCCLPGVIYFRQTYSQVVDYLSNIKCHKKYAIDTAFDDLPKRTHLQTYLVEPNLVRHIGLYSRLRKAYVSPYLLD